MAVGVALPGLQGAVEAGPMEPLHFLIFIVRGLLNFVVFTIFASAILSWLVAFDVINLRNGFVYQVVRFLEAVTRPILAPVRRIIPPLGGVDISPLIVILVIMGALRYLIPYA
jgi:YggT family protein